jgi:hypothetical protein
MPKKNKRIRMKRRDAIFSLSLMNFFILNDVFGKSVISTEKSLDRICPEEKFERRKYDRSQPKIIFWKTDENKQHTAGFVESASDDKRILYIAGFLVRQEIVPELSRGFLLHFATTLSYLSLPRRLAGNPEVKERYSFSEQFSERSKGGIKKGLVKIDYKKTELIENGKSYFASKIVNDESYDRTSDYKKLIKIDGPQVYPGIDLTRSYFEIEDVIFFDIDHVPLKFEVKLPPLIIDGVEVRLPVCYFEPYDIVSRQWVK